ncbi:hypothetical protein GCM10009559_68280 [Pseudonocardia zijingensis]|uniref:Nucleotidyltransferase n=1 Tax=Pseudonocardia zijingensis TaxID=153376 RepID=A0ABN1NC17_9PSEU
MHGIAIPGTDDHDEMGVFVEPAECVVGLAPPVPHYVFRTQPEGARSGPGDTDLVMYSLRKYLRLATKGNPTALLPLFAQTEAVLVLTPLGEELRALAPAVLSQRAVREVLRHGRLTLPMPAAEREEVLRVKSGGVPEPADVLDRIAAVQAEIEERLDAGRTPLPAEPDLGAVSAWATAAHRRHWA